jgi:uncharacterized protein YcbK (DUF882 family)
LAVAGALLSVLLASCTSSGDANLSAEGFNSSAAMMPPATGAASKQASENQAAPPSSTDGALPDQVASLPGANPATSQPQDKDAVAVLQTEASPAKPADAAAKPEQTAAEASNAPAGKAANAEPKAEQVATAVPGETIVTALDTPQADAPKKKSFFGSMFSTTSANAAPMRSDRSGAAAPVRKAAAKETIVENIPAPAAKEPAKAAKQAVPENLELDMASLSEPGPGKIRKNVQLTAYVPENDSLPGVRQSALFEIKRKSGIDDDSDIDLHEEDEYGGVQLASAGGMARLAPNGLLKQTERVDVACLKPSLVRVLKAVERRYGRKLIVTSGYRSRSYNISVRGAKNSMHMYCAAADIQVPGVSKFELANFLRAMPGRGGVGTYCHTNSVHVDIGPERDWNWKCRRRK